MSRSIFTLILTIALWCGSVVVANAKGSEAPRPVVSEPVSRSAAATAEWMKRFCRYQSVDGRAWTIREVHLTIHCGVRAFRVSHSIADTVASRESGMRSGARNTSSGACGIFQHMPRYWPGRVGDYNHARPRWDLHPSCFNARSNILVSLRMAAIGGWGPWGM